MNRLVRLKRRSRFSLGFLKLGENKNEELEEAINRLRTLQSKTPVDEFEMRNSSPEELGNSAKRRVSASSHTGVEPWSTKSG